MVLLARKTMCVYTPSLKPYGNASGIPVTCIGVQSQRKEERRFPSLIIADEAADGSP
jgi:hypothetical protein